MYGLVSMVFGIVCTKEFSLEYLLHLCSLAPSLTSIIIATTYHRIGSTVRQQIWSILHYPLHIAVLICVERNTSLIVWNSAAQGLKGIWSLEPMGYSDATHSFQDTTDYLGCLNRSMYETKGRCKNKYWNAMYS